MSLLPAYKPSPFLENIIRFLMPYFLPVTPGPAEARAEILETLASYNAFTRSTLLSAAQAIAFGFATLETLQEAKDPDLNAAMRLRHRSCANALTRSAEKAENALAHKRDNEATATPRPPTERSPQAAQTHPADDMSDPDAQAAIAFAQAQIAQHRQKAAQGKPTPHPARPDLTPEEQEEHDRMWGLAFMNALNGVAIPGQTTAPPTL
jgi:hypothetical protein